MPATITNEVFFGLLSLILALYFVLISNLILLNTYKTIAAFLDTHNQIFNNHKSEILSVKLTDTIGRTRSQATNRTNTIGHTRSQAMNRTNTIGQTRGRAMNRTNTIGQTRSRATNCTNTIGQTRSRAMNRTNTIGQTTLQAANCTKTNLISETIF